MGRLDRHFSILLIDDDAIQLRIVARQLANLGYTAVTPCANPEEAMAWVKADPQRFGLVLCDLQMPGLDGLGVIRALADLGYPGQFLLASGDDLQAIENARHQALQLGVNWVGAIGKPARPEQLSALLAPR